jgi:hypothetical protein
MWENSVEADRPQMTIWRMRIACWVPKATDTHSGCVILIALLRQQWLRERVSMLRYTYFAFIVKTDTQCLLRGTDRIVKQNSG